MQSARGAVRCALRRAGLARLVAVTLVLALPATAAEPLPAGGWEAPARALLQTDAAASPPKEDYRLTPVFLGPVIGGGGFVLLLLLCTALYLLRRRQIVSEAVPNPPAGKDVEGALEVEECRQQEEEEQEETRSRLGESDLERAQRHAAALRARPPSYRSDAPSHVSVGNARVAVPPPAPPPLSRRKERMHKKIHTEDVLASLEEAHQAVQIADREAALAAAAAEECQREAAKQAAAAALERMRAAAELPLESRTWAAGPPWADAVAAPKARPRGRPHPPSLATWLSSLPAVAQFRVQQWFAAAFPLGADNPPDWTAAGRCHERRGRNVPAAPQGQPRASAYAQEPPEESELARTARAAGTAATNAVAQWGRQDEPARVPYARHWGAQVQPAPPSPAPSDGRSVDLQDLRAYKAQRKQWGYDAEEAQPQR